jgi:hypothetical protein
MGNVMFHGGRHVRAIIQDGLESLGCVLAKPNPGNSAILGQRNLAKPNPSNSAIRGQRNLIQVISVPLSTCENRRVRSQDFVKLYLLGKAKSLNEAEAKTVPFFNEVRYVQLPPAPIPVDYRIPIYRGAAWMCYFVFLGERVSVYTIFSRRSL